jgi:nitrogen regulatory protein PII
MRELEASVLTFNLDRVKEELARLGLGSITVSEAAVSPADFLPRIQVRVVVPDHLADRAAEVLRREA